MQIVQQKKLLENLPTKLHFKFDLQLNFLNP